MTTTSTGGGRSGNFMDILLQESFKHLATVLQQELKINIKDIFAELPQQLPDFGGGGSGGAAHRQSLPSLNIVIQNNVNASVTARETSDPFGQKQLEITIDQMVANALVRGRQTSGVMSGLFNILPGLSGR